MTDRNIVTQSELESTYELLLRRVCGSELKTRRRRGKGGEEIDGNEASESTQDEMYDSSGHESSTRSLCQCMSLTFRFPILHFKN